MPETEDDLPPLDSAAIEVAIEKCVRRFYEGAHADPLLGPVMTARIKNFERHVRTVSDFWSHTLLGTSRYKGKPYPPHVSLPIQPEHFDRWLALFEEAATIELAPPQASLAIAKARHMARSFRAGMFPFEGLDLAAMPPAKR